MAAPIFFAAAARAQFVQLQSDGLWKLSVITGGSGTNCAVFIDIYGEGGNTGEIQLGHPGGKFFEPDTTSEFAVKLPGDIGDDIYKIRVYHDNSGDRTDWLLEKIIMCNMTGMVPFPCATYLSPNKGDKQCLRELPATRPGETPLPMKKYEIHCKTANETFSGTKANVEIMLIGERGTSGARHLGSHNCLDDDRKDQFKKGRTAKFFIEAVDLGKIKKIEVGHDGERKKDGWYLQHILVKEYDGPTYFFSGDVWICKHRGNDTTRQLDRTGILDDSDDGEDEEEDDDDWK